MGVLVKLKVQVVWSRVVCWFSSQN